MDEKDFVNYLNAAINNANALLLDICVSVCELSVAEARNKGKYLNRTGVLRSSLGYAVAHNGQIYKTGGFLTVLNGADGTVVGKELAIKLAKESTGITGYVVAGAKYAAFVNAKGFDVIDSAEILAESVVPQILRSIGFILR